LSTSRSPLYSAEHVQLPNRVLLLCSPCAPCLQVPCSASRVVPGAHRVVGPGTHRGSGPREVHTTPAPARSRSHALPRGHDALAPACTPPRAHANPEARLDLWYLFSCVGPHRCHGLAVVGCFTHAVAGEGALLSWLPSARLATVRSFSHAHMCRPRSPCPPPPMAPARAPPRLPPRCPFCGQRLA
jgi:hypothetical protein